MSDLAAAARQPDVTVVMCPREQWSYTRRSIDSLYDDQSHPFDFICIDGGSPRKVRNYLRSEAKRRGFRLIRTAHYLAPGEARNLALDEVKTRYVVFIDNDVVVAPMWLAHLVRCADETGATIVSPLTCIGEPIHTTIHMAGGNAAIIEEGGRRIFRESHHFPDCLVPAVCDKLVRQPIELAEFHGMLVRTEWFEQHRRFDENVKAIYEHVDFCLTVRQHGGSVVIEPRAIVTQIFGPPLAWIDLKFFFCRWCDEWTTDSERYFHEKWGTVVVDTVFKGFVRTRRRHALQRLRQVAQTLLGWRISEWLLERVAEAFVRSAKRGRAAAYRASRS